MFIDIGFPEIGGFDVFRRFFRLDEIQHHLLVIVDIEAFGVDFREHIQRAFRLGAGYARNFVNELPRAITLFV